MSTHNVERVELFALELEREWPEVSEMLTAYAKLLADRAEAPSAHVQFGDEIVIADTRVAVVADDGSILRTPNGRPITPGTSLWLRARREGE